MARRASDRDPELDKPAEEVPVVVQEPAPAVSVLDGGNPGEYIRVKHPKTGDYFTTTRALAHRMGATHIPGHDAVDKYGQPLPRKIKES